VTPLFVGWHEFPRGSDLELDAPLVNAEILLDAPIRRRRAEAKGCRDQWRDARAAAKPLRSWL